MQTVIFLHGFGENASVWANLTEALAFEARCLTPDYSDLALPTVEAYADWLRGWLDARQTEPMVLIGHSMGGYIALAFAERYPARLTGLGLAHSTAYADTDERKQKRLDSVKAIEEKGAAAFLEKFIPNLFAESFAEGHPEVLAAHFETVKNLPTEALVAAMNAMRTRPDRRAVLETAPFPVLFLIGLADRSVSPEDSLEQVKLPAQTQELVLEGVGHSGMVEAPEAFLSAVRHFLERVEKIEVRG
ncbi:MAG: alpha/beta hydrolase [Sphingobacteriaceae bacterium]|nr:alpha/beta hydrolase [Cytophagaceae bacterium]